MRTGSSDVPVAGLYRLTHLECAIVPADAEPSIRTAGARVVLELHAAELNADDLPAVLDEFMSEYATDDAVALSFSAWPETEAAWVAAIFVASDLADRDEACALEIDFPGVHATLDCVLATVGRLPPTIASVRAAVAAAPAPDVPAATWAENPRLRRIELVHGDRRVAIPRPDKPYRAVAWPAE